MHILHITPYYAPAYEYGGVVRAVEGMAGALMQRQHTITILTTDALNATTRIHRDQKEVTDSNGIRIIRAPNLSNALRWRYNLSLPLDLTQSARRIISQSRPDVVHLHEFRTAENLMLAKIFTENAIPIVMSPHGTLIYDTGRSLLKQVWDRLFSKQVASRIKHVIALTQQEKADVQRLWRTLKLKELPVSVIPNGVHLPTTAEYHDAPAFLPDVRNRRVVLFLGRLHQRKGVDVLLRAFKQADVPDTLLILAGPDQGMQAQLAPLLDERIVMTGYLDSAQREQALGVADVFALPATGEGLSMAVLEALSAGVPVLISPGCNLPDVADAGAGLIVAPQVDALAAALRQLLTHDQTALQRMGENARQLAQERFSWPTIAAQLEAVYQHVL